MKALVDHPCDAARLLSRLAPVVQFIEKQLAEKLSVPELAQQVGISPYHFVRLFKQTTGLTPHQYLLSRRIERARRLLEDENLSIAVIAVDTGFASQSHLTELFRREFGITPAVYRSRHGDRQTERGHENRTRPSKRHGARCFRPDPSEFELSERDGWVLN